LIGGPQVRPVAGNVAAWPKNRRQRGEMVIQGIGFFCRSGDETREHEIASPAFPAARRRYRMLVGHDVQERRT